MKVLAEKHVQGRLGKPEEIAKMILVLADNKQSAFMTGQTIIVDGGLTAAGPELSRRFPRNSARDSNVSGVTKGSTGEAPAIRRLDTTPPPVG